MRLPLGDGALNMPQHPTLRPGHVVRSGLLLVLLCTTDPCCEGWLVVRQNGPLRRADFRLSKADVSALNLAPGAWLVRTDATMAAAFNGTPTGTCPPETLTLILRRRDRARHAERLEAVG